MTAFDSLLRHQPVAFLDGGLGTELEQRGVVINNTRLWSASLLLHNPAVLQDIHYDYFKAGADIGTTSSYQASVSGFEAEGVSAADAAQLFIKSVELCDAARNQFWEEHIQGAAGDGGDAAGASTGQCKDGQSWQGSSARRHRPLVAYSCGAYGASLADGSEFTGSYADSMTVEQLMAFHRSRLQPVKGHPAIDLLAFETVPCLKEAEAIVRLLDTEGFGVPAWISFSCRDGSSTNHGESFTQQCAALAARCPAVVALGVNCTAPKHVPALLHGASQTLDAEAQAQGGRRPVLLCYPNSGEGWDVEGRCWVPLPGLSEPEGFAAQARDWVQAGARIVGGCCRTTPAHIAQLRKVLLGT